MTQIILTPQEVIKYTNLGADFPSCDIGDISTIVLDVFRKKLGSDFYAYILEGLADYTYTNYIEGAQYQKDDVVTYNGILWQATQITTDIAGNPNSWELAPKFTNSCLNDLWCDYLAKYLSWAVRSRKTTFWFYASKVTVDGFVKNASSEKMLDRLIKATEIEENSAFWALDAYLKENKNTCGFDSYIGNIECDCNSDCGCEKTTCKDSCNNDCTTTEKQIEAKSYLKSQFEFY